MVASLFHEDPLSARRASVAAQHIQMGAAFINDDQPTRR